MVRKQVSKAPFWASRFRELLREKKTSVAAVARAMGRPPAGVHHWVNGTREILLTQFLDLCRAAKLDPVIVLYGAGYIPAELREQVQGLTKYVLEADPSSKPGYPALSKKLAKGKA